MSTNGKNGTLLNFLVLSEKRKNLLFTLNESPKTLGEIKDSLGVSSASIIPQIRKMEEKQLIHRTDRRYELTEIGEILAEYFSNFEEILRILGEDRKFWSEHKICAIPEEFRMNLHELGKYELIRSTSTDFFRPHKEYIKNLVKAERIKIVSPVLLPGYPGYVLDLAEKGAEVSIIVTGELLETIKEKYKKELARGLSYKNTSIMVTDEKIEFAFTVTDFFLSMRLFLKDGTYDFYQNIMSFEKSAVEWGEDLFYHYGKLSRRVDIQDLR